MKTAILIGATGLVGGKCLEILLDSPQYSEVVVISRKYMEVDHPKFKLEIIEFNDLHKSWDKFRGDDLFYCLGTTMRNAKTKKNFRKIELDYCINIAKIAHHNKVSQFLLVSAMGANENAFLFYNKTKGEIEAQLKQIGFKTLQIFRPGLLLGKREEFRFFESISQGFFKVFNYVLIGPLKGMRAITAHSVAKAMVIKANEPIKGTAIYSNRNILEIA